MEMIPLTKPYIDQEIKDRVLSVLDSGYITEGPVTKELEEKVKAYIGCQHAIAVSSCTTGLELALRTLKIGPGDEVIIPDYTYPATGDVVAITGANIVVVDVNPRTMLIEYDQIEKAITNRTKAIIAVSLFGNPLDYDKLAMIKEKHDLYLVEDAACAIGAKHRSIYAGNFADISVFSFHPRKFITTGEGGMITTNRQSWADFIRSYKKHGISIDNPVLPILFERIGTNYKLSDILSAVGLGQINHIDKLLTKRFKLSESYKELLKNTNNVKIPEVTSEGLHSYQSFCVFVKDVQRVIETMGKAGIQVQIGTYALHKQKAFSKSLSCRFVGEMTGSALAFETCLALPLYHDLTFQQQQYIVENLVATVGN